MFQKMYGLSRNMRIIIFAMLGLLMVLSFYNLYRVYREPSKVAEDLPVYSYQHQGELDYTVNIKPNSVFSEKTVGPGEFYYTNLLESIDARCSYTYTADQSAELATAYSVVAVVEEPGVWSKEFPLVPEKVTKAEENEISFTESFSFNLEAFENFVEDANMQLGVYAEDPKVTIGARINTVAETAEGRTSGELIPSLVIPLGVSQFEIAGTSTLEKDGALTKPAQVSNSGLIGRKIRAFLLMGVVILLGVAFTRLTESKEPARPDTAGSFWRRYGDRLVKAGDDFTVPDDLILIALHSPEDLLKVADEAGKPIIYQETGHSQSVPTCFVIDGLTAYRYLLQDPQQSHEVTLPSDSCQGGQENFGGC
ncbi:MAG: DUF5305 family protein [Syntrophaceticus sp.]|nr:DUF5305 family protein [Syntrophaceticus sp.]MDD3315596.1 DUF5305 family protein [Syntrophaceticus sp.]MDD4359794.1 DUF5305 family protein [Syntrophaceticus sp.]MDD4782432.1 DUF5305 family protein [Syntrophaceticus sp.]